MTISCKEVSRTVAADELKTAGWRRRLSVQLHLLMCRHCRRYARQIWAIGEAARRLFGDTRADPNARLRTSILEQLPPKGGSAREPGE